MTGSEEKIIHENIWNSGILYLVRQKFVGRKMCWTIFVWQNFRQWARINVIVTFVRGIYILQEMQFLNYKWSTGLSQNELEFSIMRQIKFVPCTHQLKVLFTIPYTIKNQQTGIWNYVHKAAIGNTNCATYYRKNNWWSWTNKLADHLYYKIT